MIENGEVLATWQFDEFPAGCMICRSIQDHRAEYLAYQGPVSNGRGMVERADSGICFVDQADDEWWALSIEGNIITGRFQLIHKDGDEWLLLLCDQPNTHTACNK